MSYEISINGDEWTFKIGTPAGEKTLTFNIGEEHDSVTLDQRPVKVSL